MSLTSIVFESGERQTDFELCCTDLARALESEAKSPQVWADCIGLNPIEFERVLIAAGLGESERSGPKALHEALSSKTLRRGQLRLASQIGNGVGIVIRSVDYDQQTKELESDDILAILGSELIITASLTSSSASRSLEALQSCRPNVGQCVPQELLETVYEDYVCALEGIENDVAQIEVDLFTNRTPQQFERISRLKRHLIELSTSLQMFGDQIGVLNRVDKKFVLLSEDSHHELTLHIERLQTRVEHSSAALTTALEVCLALVGVRQNEDMRAVSGWAAVVAVPTLLAGIWGMNFAHMPELSATLGYPIALLALLVSSIVVYKILKRRGWID